MAAVDRWPSYVPCAVCCVRTGPFFGSRGCGLGLATFPRDHWCVSGSVMLTTITCTVLLYTRWTETAPCPRIPTEPHTRRRARAHTHSIACPFTSLASALSLSLSFTHTQRQNTQAYTSARPSALELDAACPGSCLPKLET